MVDGEEGAAKFFHGSAALAEAVSGGQVQHPDAGDGEDYDAGDPDVAGCIVLLDAGDDEATKHRHQEGQEGAEQLWRCGVRVRMIEPDDGDDEGQQDEREKRVGEEPEGLAGEVADRFILRSVWAVEHRVDALVKLRLLYTVAAEDKVGVRLS